jgi:hypothetical protein
VILLAEGAALSSAVCMPCLSQPWGFPVRVWAFVFGSSKPNLVA